MLSAKLDEATIKELTGLRRKLHAIAEVSGKEIETASIISTFISQFSPDEIISDIGGHGLAAVYRGMDEGPSTLIRCELDALPIPETALLDHGSKHPGSSHKCGHDGHMAIVSGLAPLLHAKRPEKGKVILLYQPAEETGQGAALVLKDNKFSELKPDYVFALHNIPGFPAEKIILKSGPFALASKGMIIKLIGKTSHAAEPEKGNSPVLAMAQLMKAITAMPSSFKDTNEFVVATVIHARLGEVAFGTTPGEGVVMATLRTGTSEAMELLSENCVELAERTAASFKLGCSITWTEVFPPTVNDAECVKIVEEAAASEGMSTQRLKEPFGWSEDFGHFTESARGALFGLGAGNNQPALHNPAYDFPDKLIPVGVKIFAGIINHLNGMVSSNVQR